MKPHTVILAYRHPGVVSKLQEEHGMSKGEAQDLFVDLMRFLIIGGNGQCCIPSQKIDDAWHAFILFTADYKAFCDEFIGHFIHHRPLIWNEKRPRAIKGKALFRKVCRLFGNISPDNWIGTSAGSGCCDVGCQSYDEPQEKKVPLTLEEKLRERIKDLKLEVEYYKDLHKNGMRETERLFKEKSALEKKVDEINSKFDFLKQLHKDLIKAHELFKS